MLSCVDNCRFLFFFLHSKFGTNLCANINYFIFGNSAEINEMLLWYPRIILVPIFQRFLLPHFDSTAARVEVSISSQIRMIWASPVTKNSPHQRWVRARKERKDGTGKTANKNKISSYLWLSRCHLAHLRSCDNHEESSGVISNISQCIWNRCEFFSFFLFHRDIISS